MLDNEGANDWSRELAATLAKQPWKAFASQDTHIYKFFTHEPTHTMCLLLLPLGPSPALFEGLSMRTSARRATIRPSEEAAQYDAEHAAWLRRVELIHQALSEANAVELETARSEASLHLTSFRTGVKFSFSFSMDALPTSDALDVFRTQFIAPLIAHSNTDASFAEQVVRATSTSRLPQLDESPAIKQPPLSSATPDFSIPATAQHVPPPQLAAADKRETSQIEELGVDSDGFELEEPSSHPIKQSRKHVQSPSPSEAIQSYSRAPSTRRALSQDSLEGNSDKEASSLRPKPSLSLTTKQQNASLRSRDAEVEDPVQIVPRTSSPLASNAAAPRNSVSADPTPENPRSAEESCTEEEEECDASAAKRARGQATTRGGRGTGYRRAGAGSRQKKAF